MKESHRRTLGILQSGFIKILKIIWIVIKSFFEAITWDFYNNIKKYWKKCLQTKPSPEPKKQEQKPEPLP